MKPDMPAGDKNVVMRSRKAAAAGKSRRRENPALSSRRTQHKRKENERSAYVVRTLRDMAHNLICAASTAGMMVAAAVHLWRNHEGERYNAKERGTKPAPVGKIQKIHTEQMLAHRRKPMVTRCQPVCYAP